MIRVSAFRLWSGRSIFKASSIAQEFLVHKSLAATAAVATSTTPNLLHYEWIRPLSPESNRATIVFFHGLLGHGRNIKTMAKKLCEMKRTNGLLLDVTGHGKSPPNPHASFADAVADIRYTIQDALKDKCTTSDHHALTLVGHSLGGLISFEQSKAPVRRSEGSACQQRNAGPRLTRHCCAVVHAFTSRSTLVDD
jgi:predicted alpha/beta-fold hydrolase